MPSRKSAKAKKNTRYKSTYSPYYPFVIIILIVTHLYILIRFNFVICDDDQAIMWYAASEFSQFRFHEPLFFGQAYGTMIEAFLAVPFVWIKIPYHIALPLTSCILSLLPFIIVSLYLFKRERFISASIILIFLLSVDVSCLIISSIPRSFIPGITFSAIGCFILWEKRNIPLACIASGLLLAIGYICSSNALPVVMIAYLGATLLFLQENLSSQTISRFNKNDIGILLHGMGNVLLSMVGFFIGMIYLFFSYRFYINNPEWCLHGTCPPAFGFSINTLMSNISKIGVLYGEVSPIIHSGWFLFVLLLSFVIYGLIKNNVAFSALTAAAMIFMIALLGMNKINDYQDLVLFSHTRFFLFTPPLLALLYFFYTLTQVESRKKLSSKNIHGFILLAAFFVSAYNIYCFNNNYEYFFKHGFLSPINTESIQTNAIALKEICTDENIDLIVIDDTSQGSRAFAYSAGALLNGTIDTLLTHYERRTWIYIDAKTRVEEKFMLIRTGLDEIGNIQIIGLEIINPKGVAVIPWVEANLNRYRREE